MTKEELQALLTTLPEADYWDVNEDTEQLSHTEILEALEEVISNLVPGENGLEADIREAWPNGITLYGWVRKTPSDDDIRKLRDRALDAVFNCMSEELEWTNPEDEGEPNGLLPEGFEKVIREDLKTRHIWGCDRVREFELTTERLVEIAKCEWPQWLEEEAE